MSVAIVRKPERHFRLPFAAAAGELQDDAEMTPTLLLVRLHQKSQLFLDIYYDRYGTHFTLMHDTGKGYNVGDPQKFLGALLHNAFTSGKNLSTKAKLPPAYLDMLATSPLIESCTREYRDWMEEKPTAEGDERPSPEEHFVWLSKDYTPYENDPGSPFVTPDFTLGLPPVQDWPCWVREPPWILDPEECPKLVHKVPVDSTGASSTDKGKKKKKKKKNHCHAKKLEKPELKVTIRGEGADTLFWTHAGPAKDSSSSSDSPSDGDSSLGSNPSIKPRLGTDTESRRAVALRLSPDATREPIEDDPLSNRGEGNRDQDMPNADELQGDCDPAGSEPVPVPAPKETQEGAQLDDNQMEAGNDEGPQEPKEPLEPYQIILQGFQTVSQTLLAAYGAASAEIQNIIRKSLAKTTAEDWTFVWGASGAIRQWVDSVRLAMAGSEESTTDQAQLLAEARQPGRMS